MENKDEATAGELAAIKRADDAEARAAELTADLGASKQREQAAAARIEELELRSAELEQNVGRLEGVVANLEEDLATVRRTRDQARDKARYYAKFRTRKEPVRKFGAMKDGTDVEAVKAAMADAGDAPLEIVFSDGKREIQEIDPLDVYPPAFRAVTGGQFALIEAVLVQGTSNDTRVRGVVLVRAGEQIAYTQFPEPVKVPAGQTVKFDKMIVF